MPLSLKGSLRLSFHSSPNGLILTDLAAHLSGVLSGRPIPTGPFLELAAYSEELRLETLLMKRSKRWCAGGASLLASATALLTSSAGTSTLAGADGPYDVAGAARAVGPDAGEAVWEALEAVAKLGGEEIGVRAHSHLGGAFASALAMAAVMKVGWFCRFLSFQCGCRLKVLEAVPELDGVRDLNTYTWSKCSCAWNGFNKQV